MGNPATHFAGIDVSKDTLDAALLGPNDRTRPKRFANAPAGFVALVAWADRLAPGGAAHFCPEAIGPYSAALADYLHATGRLGPKKKARYPVCPHAHRDWEGQWRHGGIVVGQKVAFESMRNPTGACSHDPDSA